MFSIEFPEAPPWVDDKAKKVYAYLKEEFWPILDDEWRKNLILFLPLLTFSHETSTMSKHSLGKKARKPNAEPAIFVILHAIWGRGICKRTSWWPAYEKTGMPDKFPREACPDLQLRPPPPRRRWRSLKPPMSKGPTRLTWAMKNLQTAPDMPKEHGEGGGHSTIASEMMGLYNCNKPPVRFAHCNPAQVLQGYKNTVKWARETALNDAPSMDSWPLHEGSIIHHGQAQVNDRGHAGCQEHHSYRGHDSFRDTQCQGNVEYQGQQTNQRIPEIRIEEVITESELGNTRPIGQALAMPGRMSQASDMATQTEGGDSSRTANITLLRSLLGEERRKIEQERQISVDQCKRAVVGAFADFDRRVDNRVGKWGTTLEAMDDMLNELEN